MHAARRLAVILMLALVAATGAASAHAVLLESSPADGAVLRFAPREIALRFNETVTPVFLRVLDAKGAEVQLAATARTEDQTVRLTLPPVLADGTYVVSYRVISADTHPVGASLIFAVGPPGTVVGATSAPSSSDMIWTTFALGDRAVLDLAFLVAVGGGLFALLMGEPLRRPARVTILVAAALAAITSILSLGIEGGLATESPVSALAERGVWLGGLDTGLKTSAIVTILGLAIFAFGVARGGPLPGVALIGAALAAAGYALSGHVATADPRWLTAPALWLHLVCGAFWAGSLIPLFRLLSAQGQGAVVAVEQFSRVAVAAVAVIILAGAAMTLVQLTRPSDFIVTAYGELLGLKLVMVAGLFAVAACNRLALTPALRRGRPGAPAWLKRSIALELVLMAAIVVFAASLGQATPPRALAEQALVHPTAEPPGYFVEVADVGINAFITLEPARSGLNRVRLDLMDSGDTPVTARELTLSIANPVLGIEPSEHALRAAGPGVYELADLPFPASGTWTLKVGALVSDFEKRVFTTEVTIQ